MIGSCPTFEIVFSWVILKCASPSRGTTQFYVAFKKSFHRRDEYRACEFFCHTTLINFVSHNTELRLHEFKPRTSTKMKIKTRDCNCGMKFVSSFFVLDVPLFCLGITLSCLGFVFQSRRMCNRSFNKQINPFRCLLESVLYFYWVNLQDTNLNQILRVSPVLVSAPIYIIQMIHCPF